MVEFSSAPALPPARFAFLCYATAGLPVAYGVCESVRARQVYWADREHDNEPLRFRQYLSLEPGEQVVLAVQVRFRF